MTNIILPCAGSSSRFPNVKPKWLLTHPLGNPMVFESIRGLNIKDENIYLVCLNKHINDYAVNLEKLEEIFYELFPKATLNFVSLDQETKNQPETVYNCIQRLNLNGSIFIKDCDNFYSSPIPLSNSVSSFDVHDLEYTTIGNKSFIQCDENGFVINIVEKKVISSEISVGGYCFSDASEFCKYFLNSRNDNHLYISHIIFKMILDGVIFQKNEVRNYLDWGTIKEWNQYKSSYNTLFLDIDGVIFKNSGEYCGPKIGTTDIIKNNIDIINKLYDTGRTQIILTTARKSKYKNITMKDLKDNNIKFHNIIFDLFHSKRVIINDYASTNSYPSCEAINLKRDSEDLEELLEGILK